MNRSNAPKLTFAPTLDDRRFMRQALILARRAAGQSSPNPTVGCVIVREVKVVGKGWHQYSLRDHAEVRALREAETYAAGGTAYLTLEPCSHHGRTPPCTDALIQAGIRRTVVATKDPNPRVLGKGIERLRDAGIQVDVGLFQAEALEINEPFACFITTGRPLVVGKVGMSLDGRIATCTRDARWITSAEARSFGQLLRRNLDALLVGVETILADDPELTYREEPRKDRPLTRVVLDSKLRTPPTARIFQAAGTSPVVIFCQADALPERRRVLESRGAEVISVPQRAGGLDLECVVAELARKEILGLLVEGGSEVHWSFLASELLDKFFFILGPLVLGGKDAVPAIGGRGFETVSLAPEFKISRTFRAGPDLILETYPRYSRSMVSPWLLPKIVPSDVPDPGRSSKQK